MEELDAASSPVYILGGWCSPEEVLRFTLDDTFDDLRNLGKIFGVSDRAEKLISELQGQLDDVKKRVEGRTPVKVLATDGGKGPVNAYGGSGITHQMITLAERRERPQGRQGRLHRGQRRTGQRLPA
ncbi:ABC transporter substrate-binding protein [Nonomuraea ferruginea]